jgi:hypothetical protein
VVDRGADDRQAQRHIDRLPEAGVLEHRQALVVVHGQHRVERRQVRGREQGIGRQRPGQVKTLRARGGKRRGDHVDLLASQVAPLAGVRIQAAHGDARPGDAEPAAQVPIQDAQRAGQAVAGQGLRHLPQRQMGGGQCHPQRAGHQQHHHLRGAGAGGQILGVAAERNAGVADHALVQRRGHHGIEASIEAAGDGMVEALQQRQGVGRIGAAGRRRARQVHLPDVQRAGRLRGPRLVRIERPDVHREAQRRCAGGQVPGIADEGQAHIRPGTVAGQLKADVRPDASRLADRDRQTDHRPLYRRSST